MLLTAKKLYLVLCTLVGLALVALAGSAYMANQVLTQKSKVVHDASLKTKTLEDRQNKLRKARANIEKYKDLAQIATSIVPRDKNQAQTVREITSLAARNGIKLGSITFPSSSLGNTTAPAGGSGDSQLKAVPTIPGTFVLSITVTSDTKAPATFKNFIKFLEALEQNRRTALVTGITITPDTSNPDELQFTLTLNEYIKP
jgi:hypothetical protein